MIARTDDWTSHESVAAGVGAGLRFPVKDELAGLGPELDGSPGVMVILRKGRPLYVKSVKSLATKRSKRLELFEQDSQRGALYTPLGKKVLFYLGFGEEAQKKWGQRLELVPRATSRRWFERLEVAYVATETEEQADYAASALALHFNPSLNAEVPDAELGRLGGSTFFISGTIVEVFACLVGMFWGGIVFALLAPVLSSSAIEADGVADSDFLVPAVCGAWMVLLTQLFLVMVWLRGRGERWPLRSLAAVSAAPVITIASVALLSVVAGFN